MWSSGWIGRRFTAAGGVGKTPHVSSTIESMSEGFQAQLPCEPESVAPARVAAGAWCGDAGTVSEVFADVRLVSDRDAARATPRPGLRLGWQIIRRVAESVDIDHTHHGTRVTMWFDLRRSADRAFAQ